MDSLLHQAPCGFISIGEERTIVGANQRIEEWLRYLPGELSGRPFESILTMGGRIFCQTHIFPLLKLKGQVDEIYFSLKVQGGGTLDVLTSAARRQQDGVTLYDFIFLPMRQRREYEDELLQAKKVAEEAGQAKAKFLSMMSHELRTPMNAILGFGQLLSRAKLPPKQAEGVQYILRAGQHLLELINEVLDLSRIDAGRLNLELKPVPARGAMQSALELASALAEKAGIAASLESGSGDEFCVLADPIRLRQVLLNLLANAIKYNRPQGWVRLRCELVEASDDSHAQRLRFVVSDTGLGIPLEKQAKLFLPFERLGAEESAIEGTGLGLALCKRLTEAMAGMIGVDSVPGSGSRFWIELPTAQVAAPEQDSRSSSDGLAGSHGATLPRSTILYIEDNVSNRALLRGVFEDDPRISLILSPTGEEGLLEAIERMPDLILLDLQLPDLPGEQVLAHLRAHSATASIPVVVLSADATPQQRTKLLQAGARDYLTKPLDLDVFLRVVDTLLEEEKPAPEQLEDEPFQAAPRVKPEGLF